MEEKFQSGPAYGMYDDRVCAVARGGWVIVVQEHRAQRCPGLAMSRPSDVLA
jgi:hypothetical protein